MNKFNHNKRSHLDSDERKKILPPFKILKMFGLKSGDIFADIGAGTGYFSFPALEIVGTSGFVYALDISEIMLNEIDTKIKKRNLLSNKNILS